jgi:hypothetical protein
VDAGSFGDELHLVVPPYSVYLRAVRLVAADAAVRAGLDVEETEDFRLAVNELSHMMLTQTDHPLFLSFTVVDGSVLARGSTRARAGTTGALTTISASILGTLSDFYTVEVHDGDLEFVVARGGARARR